MATQAAGGSFPSSPPEPNAPLSETDPAGTSEVAVGVYPEQRASGFFATGTDANVPQDGEAMAEPDIESTSRLEEDLFLQIGSTTEYVVRQVSLSRMPVLLCRLACVTCPSCFVGETTSTAAIARTTWIATPGRRD